MHSGGEQRISDLEGVNLGASLEKEREFVKETPLAHTLCGKILSGGNLAPAPEMPESNRPGCRDGGPVNSNDLTILHVDDAVGLGGEFVVMGHDHERGSTGFIQGAH